ncbi:MAG TPA: hypothetical protein VJW96_00295 [Terriglobales bacterium]|nr:hypothetical protein [Terriglobales bacterium]
MGNNQAITAAILRHLYEVRQQEATAADGGLALDQLFEVLKKKRYKHGEVASNLDYLVARGLVTEVVEHRRIVTIPETAENPEIKTYRISGSGIVQVKAETSRWAALLHSVQSKLEPAFIVILNVIAGLLFFPFNLLTSVPAVLAICISAGLGWFGLRYGRRRLLVASGMIALVGIAWAAVGLFVVLQKPLYCYSSGTTSLFKGEVFQVGAGKPLGHVFYITDPVRSSPIIRYIAQTLSRRIIFIEGREENGQHAILIPMTDAVVHRVSGTGDARSAEEIWLVHIGPTLEVGTDDARKTVTVGVGFTCVSIMFYLRKASDKPGLPWQAVIYGAAGESNSALYVSYLDVALSAAARGEFETSIEALEVSYKYAPSEIERARNRVLLANVSLALLTGTLGGTQALSFMNEGMQHWAAAHRNEPVERVSLSDPVDIWLYYVFREAFFWRQAEYPNWARLLVFHGSPVRVERQRPQGNGLTFYSYTEPTADSPEQSLISAESDQLMALVSTTDDLGVLQRALTDKYGSSLDVRRWLVDTMMSAVVSEKFFPPSRQARRAIDWAIQQMPEPWYSQYSKAWHMGQVILQVDMSKPMETAERNVRLARELGFEKYARAFGEMLSQLSASKKAVVRIDTTGITPSDPWYHHNFLDWFAATVLAAGARAVEDCKSAGPQCRESLESTADLVQRDRGGRGELFAPGVALVLVEAQFADQDLDPNLTVIYREATGAEAPPQPVALQLKTVPPAQTPAP